MQVKNLPALFEMISFTFYVSQCVLGVFVEYHDFMNWIHELNEYEKVAIKESSSQPDSSEFEIHGLRSALPGYFHLIELLFARLLRLVGRIYQSSLGLSSYLHFFFLDGPAPILLHRLYV